MESCSPIGWKICSAILWRAVLLLVGKYAVGLAEQGHLIPEEEENVLYAIYISMKHLENVQMFFTMFVKSII